MEKRSTTLQQAKKIEENLINSLKKSNSKYLDDEFPANDQSIGKRVRSVDSWKRPSEINKKPSLFVDGVSSGDVMQGELGDCWLIGSMSVIATRKDLLLPLFVSSHPEYGFYQIKFYLDGDWRVVTIDDRIPCNSQGQCVFARSREKDEFWVPLLEKAFAKLNGSYSVLESGQLEEGMTDLTGEGSESLDFEDEKVQVMIKDGTLWDLIRNHYDEEFLMGCSNSGGGIENDNGMGILTGHAYSILKAKELKTGGKLIKLLQIRNPWGKHEWKGPWSDGSKEWNEETLKKLDYKFGDDGVFWISYQDFLTQYNSIAVCRLLTDEVGKVWNKFSFQGTWDQKTAGGCCNNPTWTRNYQYWIEVTKNNTQIFAHLAQEDNRSKGQRSRQYGGIGIYLWESTNPQQKITDRGAKSIFRPVFTRGRENTAHLSVNKGYYVLMPCTFNAGEAGNFFLSIYSDDDIKCGEIGGKTGFQGKPQKFEDQSEKMKKLNKNKEKDDEEDKKPQGNTKPSTNNTSTTTNTNTNKSTTNTTTNTNTQVSRNPSFKFKFQLKSHWIGACAGGSIGSVSDKQDLDWTDNLLFHLHPLSPVPSKFPVRITLQQPKDLMFKACILVFSNYTGGAQKFTEKFLDSNSPLVRQEIITLDFTFVASQAPYLIMATTEKPGQENNHLLTIESTEKLDLIQMNHLD